MERKKLTIIPPEGFEVDWTGSNNNTIIFKPSENKLPKTWEALNLIEGSYINGLSETINVLPSPATIANRNLFPTKKLAEAALALAQLLQLRDRYNDGWKPNWDVDNEPKFGIEVNGNNISQFTHYSTQRVLVFKVKKLRDKFLNNFQDLLETAKPLL